MSWFKWVKWKLSYAIAINSSKFGLFKFGRSKFGE